MLCLTVRLIYLWYIDVFSTIDLSPQPFIPASLPLLQYVISKNIFVKLYKHEGYHHLGVIRYVTGVYGVAL